VSFSSSDALVRLGGALAASGALHLGAALAIDGLPWGARGAPQGAQAGAGARLEVDLRLAQGPASVATPMQERKRAPQTPSRYYLARELDVRPAPRSHIEPAYPNDAFLRDVSGRVVVRLFISESGAVDKALIVHAEPAGYFEEAVQQAFRAARFAPAMKNGRAVKAEVVLEVHYDSPRRLTAQ